MAAPDGGSSTTGKAEKYAGEHTGQQRRGEIAP